MRVPSSQWSSFQIAQNNTQSILHIFQLYKLLESTCNLPYFSISNVNLLIIELITCRVHFTRHNSSYPNIQFANVRDIFILCWFLRLVLLRRVLLLFLFLLFLFLWVFFLFFFLTFSLTTFLLCFLFCKFS